MKGFEAWLIAGAAIVANLWAAFKFINRPIEKNADQDRKLETLQALVSGISEDNKNSVESLKNSLKELANGQNVILSAIQKTEKDMAVLQNEVAHQGKEIDRLQAIQMQQSERQSVAFEKMTNTLDKLAESLSGRSK